VIKFVEQYQIVFHYREFALIFADIQTGDANMVMMPRVLTCIPGMLKV